MTVFKLCFLIFLFFALTLQETKAFTKLVPPDKEIIYSWTTNVKATTHLPASHASQFTLHGKIHLQSNNDSIYVKISDLVYQLDNGIISHNDETNSAPKEVHDLENVFRIIYNENGLVDSIVTQNEEKEFSRNIKKAIATIFQLNSAIFDKKYNHDESMSVKEKTILGHGNAVYSVFQHQEEIEIYKIHKMSDNQGIPSYFVTTDGLEYCALNAEESVTHDSVKIYAVVKNNGSYFINNITTTGSVVQYPIKLGSEGYVVSVNQTFRLVDIVPIKDKYHIESEHVEKTLAYRPFVENKDELTLDITNGRHKVIYKKLIPLMQNLLKDISEYLKEDHINTQVLDIKHGQVINRVQRILFKFSFKKLEELRTTLSEETIKIFYQVLPLVGSEASTFYIKTLIVEKTVDEKSAIDLLQHIAEHIKPSVRLVRKLEDLLHLNDSFGWDLRKVAILSFGNIIHKSYEHYLDSNNHLATSDFQKPYYQYVEKYIDKLKKSGSYRVQLTYLLGLRNMKLPVLADGLAPAFQGEWFENPHLRFMSIWAAATQIVTNRDKTMKYFWPIFTNRQESTEMRIFAYFYVISSQPSLSTLRTIFTLMLTEPDYELYRFHYTLAQTLAQSKEPCHKGISEKLTQMIKFAPPPREGSTSVDFFGYVDPYYGFSGAIHNIYIKTNQSRIYTMYVTSQQNNINEEKYSVYLKIHDGQMEDPGLSFSLYGAVAFDREFHIEAIIAKKTQIIETFTFDKNNKEELENFLAYWQKGNVSWSHNLLHMTYDRYHFSIIPTDLGIPVVWEYIMPNLINHNLVLSVEFTENKNNMKAHFESKSTISSHFRHGLSFYNPIADIWQGINTYQSFDIALPLHITTTWVNKERMWKIWWNKHKDNLFNVAGANSHTALVVFTTDEDEPNKSEYQVVRNGKELDEYSLIDIDDINTGYRFYGKMYNSDVDIPHGSFKNTFLRFLDRSSKYFTLPIEQLSAMFEYVYHTHLLLPRPGTYGVMYRIEPSQKFNVSKMLLTSTLKNHKREVTGHVTYESLNEDIVVKKWILDGLVKYVSGSNVQDFGAKVSSVVYGKENFQMDINGRYEVNTNNPLNLKIKMNDLLGEEHSKPSFINLALTAKSPDESCDYVTSYPFPHHRNMQCWSSYQTFRHHTYDIETINLLNEKTSSFGKCWDNVRSLFKSYYWHEHRKNNISDNSLKIDVEFPVNSQEMKIDVATNKETFEFSGVSKKYWDWFGYGPITPTQYFMYKYEKNEIDRCRISRHATFMNNHLLDDAGPIESWKTYISDIRVSSSFSLSIDVGNHNKFGLQVEENNHTFMILPFEDKLAVKLDGQVIPLEKQFYQDWMSYRVFTEPSRRLMTLFFVNYDVFVEYDDQRIEILVPQKLFGNWNGTCFQSDK